jgi:hypothetical protein
LNLFEPDDLPVLRRLAAELVSQLRAGFGDRSDGEDRFDTVAGLLGM